MVVVYTSLPCCVCTTGTSHQCLQCPDRRAYMCVRLCRQVLTYRVYSPPGIKPSPTASALAPSPTPSGPVKIPLVSLPLARARITLLYIVGINILI